MFLIIEYRKCFLSAERLLLVRMKCTMRTNLPKTLERLIFGKYILNLSKFTKYLVDVLKFAKYLVNSYPQKT